MLFNIFISYLEENVKSSLIKFDTKIGGAAVNSEEHRSLTQGSGLLGTWAQANSICFNIANVNLYI